MFRSISPNTTTSDVVVVVSATVVIVVCVAFLFSRRLSGPIMQLTLAADAVSRGQMDVPIDVAERSDEIGLLAGAIHRLRNSTRLAMERLMRSAKAG